ncbi:hypothetical protein C6361_34715 [Plantactinospora sp. BC1]|uniref:ATP-binding protein n=1 Tax=Plantactinospora sp. BC1 TaxID=2108470 RepID=UPI000D1570A9|nr:tetratricopeptide repeat protein [Plantactinospora sp. BC1]AVT33737.1 hypothetical protein C6361_34715 [Plantactinospora sp. BC1]
MRPAQELVETFTLLPDPGQAGTIDGLVERLRSLKTWAGEPSYESIKDRVNAAWTSAGRPAAELVGKTTVVDCFRPGRRRLNVDLVVAVVQALHPDPGYVTQWRQALQVIGGEIRAAGQVRVQDRLPKDLTGFTGRTAELDRIRRTLSGGDRDGGAAVVCAIAGMAGVGKTQLAIHAGHLLARELPLDRVLFVDLRGFHPDPVQPPADPAAVLDGFLRLLGMPGQQIPHDLPARVAAYRERLAGSRTLVLLDNAADAGQVRPLLPETPGCPALVTSRRRLTGLPSATQLTVDLFTPDEALAFLTRAAPQTPVGQDPGAAARVAQRCGHLPLALGLVAGHIRGTPGWTLTDHAERLDERHQDGRLDVGIELAFDLSYRHLPGQEQRLLRLAALHPGQDFDLHAATALADTDPATTRRHLDRLCADHLLQQATAGRYSFHDLVRGYAMGRARDEDPPSGRRAALTRLFDFYLATSAAAMDILIPAGAGDRPEVPPPATPAPVLAGPDGARAWLDTERPTLVAVAAHTAGHGWPAHTTRLSVCLFRYLDGGHHADALAVHGHARDVAQRAGDPVGEARALTNLGTAHVRLGRYGPAATHFRRALHLFREVGDRVGQARALTSLGVVEQRLGNYQMAIEHYERALVVCRQVGDRTGEARALTSLGVVEERLGRYESAAGHLEQALTLCRQAGNHAGEAATLNNLGDVERRLGRYASAAEHLRQSLRLFRQVGDRNGEAWTLDGLGTLHLRLDQPGQATEYHRRALEIFRSIGDRHGRAWALNGLGEAARVAGRPDAAASHHTAAIDLGDRCQQARAHAGLGHAHRSLDRPALARRHYEQAVSLYTELGMPDADQLRAHLAAHLDAPEERAPGERVAENAARSADGGTAH